MDPEIAGRFDTLEGALIRLAEAQARTDERLAKLAETQIRTDERLAKLAEAQIRTDERVATLADGLCTLTDRVTVLSDRVDRLAQLMIRGHTDAAERHAIVIDRLDKLERR